MKRSRILSLILAAAMLLSFALPVFAVEDLTPPELKSIELSVDEAGVGDEVTLTVKATDNISGVNSVSVYFYCAEKDEELYFSGWNSELTFDETEKVWTMTEKIIISETTFGGTYKIRSVTIGDVAGNGTTYYAEKTSLDTVTIPEAYRYLALTVDSDYAPEVGDTTAPELVSVSLDKTAAAVGETVTMTVTATDDTAVADFDAYFSCAENNEYFYISPAWNTEPVYDETTGLWTLTGSFTVSETTYGGSYKISYVSVSDVSYNSKTYYAVQTSLNTVMLPAESRNLTIVVDSDYIPEVSADTTAPTLLTVAVNDAEIDAPGTVTVTVTATDDLSAVDSFTAYFECSDRNAYFSVGNSWNSEEEYDEGSGIYTLTGTYSVSEYALAGSYKLKYVSIDDSVGNDTTYYAAKPNPQALQLPAGYRDIAVTINNLDDPDVDTENPGFEEKDTIPPELISVSIDKTEATVGDTITVTVTAKDDRSNLSDGNVYFRTSSDSFSIWVDDSKSYDDTTGIWTLTGSYTVSKYCEPGLYAIDYIYIYDSWGNRSYYYVDADEVNSDNEHLLPDESAGLSVDLVGDGFEGKDTVPPELISVSIDKTEATVGDKITVTVTAKDDRSNLSDGNVYFRTSSDSFSIWVDDSKSYDDTTGIWTLTGSYTVSKYCEPGLYAIDYIYIYDSWGNRSYYYVDADEVNWDNEELLPDEYIGLSILLRDPAADEETEKPGDIITSTANENLAEDITNKVAEGGTATVHFGQSATVDESVFEAIEGTDKTLHLTSDGIDWVFEGKDINTENIKDIDLSVDIAKEYLSQSENADDIIDKLDGQEGIVIHFADNGTLPGPATIRIKMDHNFQSYVGSEDLHVYYYDATNDEFVEVASELKVVDDYLEFTITHNSDYIVTGGAWVPNTGNNDNNQGGNDDNNQGGNDDNNQGGNDDNNQGGNDDNNQGGNDDNNQGGNDRPIFPNWPNLPIFPIRPILPIVPNVPTTPVTPSAPESSKPVVKPANPEMGGNSTALLALAAALISAAALTGILLSEKKKK